MRLANGGWRECIQIVQLVSLELRLLFNKQVTCDSTKNCPGPCLSCNTASDTCQPVPFGGTCLAPGNVAGQCDSGICKVGI